MSITTVCNGMGSTQKNKMSSSCLSYFKKYKPYIIGAVVAGCAVGAWYAFSVAPADKKHSSVSPVIPFGQALREDFFQDLFGIPEKSFSNLTDTYLKAVIFQGTYQNRPVYMLKKPYELKINPDSVSKTYQAGYVEILTIDALRNKTKIIEQSNSGEGTLSVIGVDFSNKESACAAYVDIGALQADSNNKDCVFQAASNFNILEFVNAEQTPETQPLSTYPGDITQGPFAAISAAPGTVLRHYFMYHDNNTTPQQWRQTKDKQVNLLDQTGIAVKNGYVQFESTDFNALATDLVGKIKVAYHRDVQVTFGQNFLKTGTHAVVKDQSQIIDQVYTAAVDFGKDNAQFKNNKQALLVAQAVLDAAYEGTIRAAYAHGKKKVFLTLIGGGVFANSPEMIAAAIEKQIDFIKQSGMSVVLNLFDINRLPQSGTDKTEQQVLQLFIALAKKGNGTYTVNGVVQK